MKLGHFAALCCLALALVMAPVVWWDMQDGVYVVNLLFLPIFGVVMGVVLLLFPGGPMTFQQAATHPSPDFLAAWKAQAPPVHRWAWLIGAFATYYLTDACKTTLAGEVFFSLFHQLTLIAILGLFYWLMRRWLKSPASASKRGQL